MSMAEKNKNKSTLTRHAGTYRFHRMPFRLMDATATFQRALHIMLKNYTWKSCFVYLKDPITFSEKNDQYF